MRRQWEQINVAKSYSGIPVIKMTAECNIVSHLAGHYHSLPIQLSVGVKISLDPCMAHIYPSYITAQAPEDYSSAQDDCFNLICYD